MLLFCLGWFSSILCSNRFQRFSILIRRGGDVWVGSRTRTRKNDPVYKGIGFKGILLDVEDCVSRIGDISGFGGSTSSQESTRRTYQHLLSHLHSISSTNSIGGQDRPQKIHFRLF